LTIRREANEATEQPLWLKIESHRVCKWEMAAALDMRRSQGRHRADNDHDVFQALAPFEWRTINTARPS
jgi:hypothetical protein